MTAVSEEEESHQVAGTQPTERQAYGEHVVHTCGFISKDGKSVTGVKVSVYPKETKLHEVVNGVLNNIKSQGHRVKSRTIRSLDGWLVKVEAEVDVRYKGSYSTMWHVFTTDSERWPQ